MMTTEKNEKAIKSGKIRQENHKKILEAAELTFVQHGYKGTSMQAIADAADLPKANVLYYFKSKQALYTSVLENISSRWDETLDHISEDDEPAETLANYISTKVDLAISYPNASKIFATEIIHGAPHLKDHLRTTLRPWVRENSHYGFVDRAGQNGPSRYRKAYLHDLVFNSALC